MFVHAPLIDDEYTANPYEDEDLTHVPNIHQMRIMQKCSDDLEVKLNDIFAPGRKLEAEILAEMRL